MFEHFQILCPDYLLCFSREKTRLQNTDAKLSASILLLLLCAGDYLKNCGTALCAKTAETEANAVIIAEAKTDADAKDWGRL